MKRIINKLKYKLRSRWQSYFHLKKQKKVRKMIIRHYALHPPEDKETVYAVNYLMKNPLTTFYDVFQENYHAEQIVVYDDPSNGLPYVIIDNKKLYFKRSQNRLTVQLLFNQLRIEQDKNSPHCYTDKEFCVSEGAVIADVGSAEGYFSLLNIEIVSKVYLFEQDIEWIEALEATFAPWREKAVIIPKFVSDQNRRNQIRLEDYFRTVPHLPNFFKIDVEGAEYSVLKGMGEIIDQPNIKIALATYHHQEDYQIFSRYFEEKDFSQKTSRGLMIYMNDLDNIRPPYFRKCLIKADKDYG